MKLAARDVPRVFAKPDPGLPGFLIYGPDAMRIALRRQDLVKALVGPEGEAEMRFTRLDAGDLRRDPAQVSDALRARGFFPGPRAVLVEDANDAAAPAIIAAMDDHSDNDATLVVTAGQLGKGSALRKYFEGHPKALAVAIYADPPGREEIEDALRRAGLRDILPEAMRDLTALARDVDPGDFRQTLERIALYKLGDDAPLSPDDVAACVPVAPEADLDDLIRVVAEGAVSDLSGMFSRLGGGGGNAVSLCIAAQRHFKALYAVSVHPGGAEKGIGTLRPPVFGTRRDQILGQARAWGPGRLESVLSLILETDRTLRSAQPVPAMALVERLFIRIAMLHARP